MFIGIDGNEANTKEKVGVSTYAYEVLWGLYNINQKNTKHNKFLIYLKTDPNNDLPKDNLLWKYRIIKGNNNWVLKNLMPSLFMNPRPDVFFTPTHYLPPFTPMPKVFTVHDLGYLDFSEQFRKFDFWQLKYWTAISVFVSKYIIAVSESTRNDIVRRYRFSCKKIITIHNGFDSTRFNNRIDEDLVRHVRNKYAIPGNYILFLSRLKHSKNIEGLLDGFDLIKDKFPDYKLIIAGKKGWLFGSIYQKVERLNIKNRVIFTDYVSEEDKPALFAGAKVFLLPSFWEGFGMDVLNALSCGTPVIVSNVASLPEVAGSAGMYIDPNRSESIAGALKEVLSLNNIEYNKLVSKGFEQVKGFSWEKSVAETLKVLEKAA